MSAQLSRVRTAALADAALASVRLRATALVQHPRPAEGGIVSLDEESYGDEGVTAEAQRRSRAARFGSKRVGAAVMPRAMQEGVHALIQGEHRV